MQVLETDRIILRTWKDADLPYLYAMNQDPLVMEYFPNLQDKPTTDAFFHKIQKHYKDHGYTLFALELKENKEFLGFVGLLHVPFKASFTPAVEIGWRLRSEYWNKGYATEAAKAVLDYAFYTLNLDRIVSFTSKINKPSIRIMEKIGLVYQEEFDHPKLEQNHRLCKHVLYAIIRKNYL